MGYVLKTTFWLGLVLSAMPLGEAPKVSEILTPAQQAAACTAASEAIAAKVGSAADGYRGLAAMGCASFATASLASAAPPAPAAAVAPPKPLTAADRKPPWLAPPPRPKTG